MLDYYLLMDVYCIEVNNMFHIIYNVIIIVFISINNGEDMPDDRSNKVSCSSFKCEVEVAIEILSGKWIPLIIWFLATEGTKRFGELRKLMPGVTQKMLTQQLRLLEKNGLVSRKIYAEVPPVVEYSLTEIGEKLVPVFNELNNWAVDYLASRKK